MSYQCSHNSKKLTVSTKAEHLLNVKFSAFWVRGLVSVHIDGAIASTSRRKPILFLYWPLPLHVIMASGITGAHE